MCVLWTITHTNRSDLRPFPRSRLKKMENRIVNGVAMFAARVVVPRRSHSLFRSAMFHTPGGEPGSESVW